MITPRTPTPVRLLLTVAVAGIVLATGACSAGSDKRAETESSAGSTTRPAAGATTTRATGDGVTTSTSAAPPKTEGKILGTSTGQLQADPNDQTPVPLRLDVTSLDRSAGDTIEVKFDLTNTSDADTFKPYRTMGDPTKGAGIYNVGGLALLDLANDKKYLTLFDSDDICLCSDVNSLEVAPGKTISLYAEITAPPKSISTVDLSVPGFSPVTGLEIR